MSDSPRHRSPSPRHRSPSPFVDYKSKWQVDGVWVPEVDTWRAARGLSWEQVEDLEEAAWRDADVVYDTATVKGMPAWAVGYIVAAEVQPAREYVDFGEGGGIFSNMERRVEEKLRDSDDEYQHVLSDSFALKVSCSR
jgi:hypothetical protein